MPFVLGSNPAGKQVFEIISGSVELCAPQARAAEIRALNAGRAVEIIPAEVRIIEVRAGKVGFVHVPAQIGPGQIRTSKGRLEGPRPVEIGAPEVGAVKLRSVAAEAREEGSGEPRWTGRRLQGWRQ